MAEGEINWKGFGRERSWYLFEIISPAFAWKD
jgi:hypothetical protein